MDQKIGRKLLSICLDELANSAEKGMRFIYKFLLRWHNHLNPDIKKERWTEEED